VQGADCYWSGLKASRLAVVIDPTPCVIYAAKSTEDRRGSIADQLADCKEAIERERSRVVAADYADEAFSAFSRSRGPGLVDAMSHAAQLAREHGIAELWSQNSDRLARGDGRSARHAVEIALWALKHDVKVRTIQDPDTFRDLLYAVVSGERNHEDSRRKGLAVAAGRRRAAIRGDYLGNKPDGYQRAVEIDGTGRVRKRLVIDPERRPVIEMIFRMALRGRECGAIARALNRRRWLTKPLDPGKQPTRWTHGRIRLVVSNPSYAGLVAVKGEIVAESHWPRYITPDEHRRLVARDVQSGPSKQRRPTGMHLLAGIATCGVCGRRLYASTKEQRTSGLVYRRYACESHAWGLRERCGSPRISADMIEPMFIANFALLHPDAQEPRTRGVNATPGVSAEMRKRVIDAAVAGDERQLDEALVLLIERNASEASPFRRVPSWTSRSRYLDIVARLDRWVAHEQLSPTETSVEDTVALNRDLRSWFSAISITVDGQGVTLVATPASAAGELDTSERTRVRIDRREWMRDFPHLRARGPRPLAWNDAEILGALQAWADAKGRSPRSWEWVRSGVDRPSSKTVVKRFTTWEHALHQAGLAPARAVVGSRRRGAKRTDRVNGHA
jgi:DNA invertase Pin-like site-specific DNA recombinase